MKIKTYSNLLEIKSFNDRFEYLKLNGIVGKETFGFDRYLNQLIYKSSKWKKIRDFVIIRDDGLDLGAIGHQITDRIIIHHMNPIRLEDLENDNEIIYDPEYLISTSFNTHNAIHYSDSSLLPTILTPRRKNDTLLW